MRRSVPIVLALVLLASAAGAAPDPERDATDRAREHLAAGDPGSAARILTAALGRVVDDAGRDRLRCLLGAAHLSAGAADRAEAVLREVRPEGPCGLRAGWSRVDALLALSRAEEAAALAEALAAGPIGPDRDGASAEGIAAIARRVAADPDRGPRAGFDLLELALRTRIAPARRDALADEAFRAWDAAGRPDAPTLCAALEDRLGAGEDPEVRARAAEVCPSRLHVDALPPGPARTRTSALRAGDPLAAALGRTRALGARPDPAEGRSLAERWEALRVTAARDAWATVGDADAGRRAIAVAAAAGRWGEVAAEARAWLERFPTDPRRAEVIDHEGAALLAHARAAADPSAALAALDALLARHPGSAAGAEAGLEAGYAARAAGDLAGARRRWEALRAAHPGSEAAAAAVRALARSRAFDDHDPGAAAAFLRAAGPDGGAEELVRLGAEDLAIAAVSAAEGPPSVRVVARNLSRVELRVHRVDPLAWLRAGRDLRDLAAIDVAPIAPDATVAVDLPEAPRWADRGIDVPVPVRGPGLYAVTAAGPAEEARALLLVSPLRAVTRTVGDDTVVAVFDDQGRPVPRAAVHLVDGAGAAQGHTDRDGTYVARGRGTVPAVVVEKGGQLALIPAGSASPSASRKVGVQATVELDRPVHLPGDHVGARIVAHVDGRPLSGAWTLWLEGPGGALPPVRAEATAFGSVTVDLPLPPAARPASGPHPRRDRWSLRALAPGEQTPRDLAEVRVADRDLAAFAATAAFDGAEVAVALRDPDDLPAVEVPLLVDGRVARTDATGVARIAGPRAGLPWAPRLELPDRPLAVLPGARPEPPAARLSATLAEDRLRPGERPVLRLDAEGPVRVVALRAVGAPPAAPARDPWVEAVDPGLRGWRREAGDGRSTPDGWWEVALDATVTEAPEVALDPLPPGTYELVVVASDLRTTARAPLRVDADALRLTGIRDVGAGDVLRLAPEGGAALVTAEGSEGLLWAGVRGPGEVASIPVDGRWRGEVLLTATGADGARHVRAVSADPDPRVDVEVIPDGPDAWTLQATVRDAAGRPIAAEVSFTAWDPRVAAVEGAPAALDAGALAPRVGPPASAWGDGGPLRHGDDGSPIASALLAESQLRRERERAREAERTGLFSDNALAEALLGDVPLEFGGGTLGAHGHGYGGGGARSGFGLGGAGSSGTGAPARPLPGHRARAVWAVVRAVDGVARVSVPDPDLALAVRATALTRDGIGRAETWVDTRGEVTLHVRDVPPGSPSDRAHPVATVVNDTPVAVSVTLSFGAREVPLALAPGEARRVIGPEAVSAGSALPVTLRGAGAPRTARFAVPLAEGEPSADGPVTVVAGGAGALAAIATRGEPVPASDAARTAAAGRAALAAWRATGASSLLPRIEAARLALRAPTVDPVDRALFLADLAAGGPLPVPAPELAEALDGLPSGGPTLARLRAAVARTLGGRPPADAEALQAEADDDRERAWVARLARARGIGPGPAAPEAPPLPGDEALIDWIVAHAADPTGAASVDGAPLDGVVVVLGRPAVAGRAHAWSASGARVGAEAPRAGRVPRGPLGVAPAEVPGWTRGACDPCRVSLDDALHLPDGGLAPTAWHGPTHGGASLWRARAPGVYHLAGVDGPDGRARGLRVEVEAGPSDDAPPVVAHAAAAHLRRVGVRAVPPRAEELPEEAVALAALDDALLGEADAEIAPAFLRVRAVAPGAGFAPEQVARAARALRATGRPVAAVEAWRAVVDHAFVAEVSGLWALEPAVGPLAVVQRTREAIARAPLGGAAGDAAYLLPGRLLELARDGLPAGAVAAGVTPTDARLTAAAWDREFLASFPGHPRAAAAGLRLGRTLLSLHAPGDAAAWAARVRRAHPDDALADALVFLEAVAATEAGEAEAAEPLLRSLADDLFPAGGGPPRPSAHADDARLALARLAESRGRFAEAARAYADTGTPEAARSLAVLQSRALDVPALVRVEPSAPAAVPVVARGVERVAVRAYRVDLRTLFLRDQGLGAARDVAVDGVSPVFDGERTLGAGPFPETHRLALPLSGPGAWLVQLDAGEVRATTLVVRSGLRLDLHDGGGERRVDLRSGDRGVAGAEVRGLLHGEVYPAVTDVRGVAIVPEGAAVLAWRGDEVAFTDPAEVAAAPAVGRGAPEPSSAPLSVVDRRLETEAARDDGAWQALTDGPDDVRLP